MEIKPSKYELEVESLKHNVAGENDKKLKEIFSNIEGALPEKAKKATGLKPDAIAKIANTLSQIRGAK